MTLLTLARVIVMARPAAASLAIVLALGAGACSSSEQTAIDCPGTTACVADAAPCPEPPDAAAPDASDSGAETRRLRVMTFNTQHAASSSLEALAAVVNAEAPDLVGLEEVDNEAARSGRVNQSYRLGQLTGMASLFRSAFTFPDGGDYGLALLSRYPIITSDKVELTSSGEQRILIVVRVEIEPGTQIPVAVTHLDLDASTRETEAAEIGSALAGEPSAILMGDLNEQPGGPAIATLTASLADVWPLAGQGGGETFPSGAPTERIDFVMLGAAWPAPLEAHVPETTASDHRPVVTTVPLPDEP